MELYGATREEIVKQVSELGQPEFRGRQVADWIYGRSAREFASMTNLPKTLRDQLAAHHAVTRSEVMRKSRSRDGTTKFLLKMADGEQIESVLLPYPDRVSVCVSTQVGCAAGCVFCATADCGLVRNLTPGEIVDQVATLQEHAGARITHVVFMGMGEPLMNLPNVLSAIELLHKEIGISMRRMTISTVGLTSAIRKLAKLDLQLTLAISLHAPDVRLRRQLIPLSSRTPLQELIEACRDYAQSTKRRVTFEYLLIAGVNDSTEQAGKLAKLLQGILCHVNLIPYNEVPGKEFKRPSRNAISAFRSVLERGGVEVTQRAERGHSIAAACGQLRAAELNKN